MPRWFNTAGPCKPGYHYMLPPARRIPQVRGAIDQIQYFVLHAPRQTMTVTSAQTNGYQVSVWRPYTT